MASDDQTPVTQIGSSSLADSGVVIAKNPELIEQHAALLALPDPAQARARRARTAVYILRVVVLAAIITFWQVITPHFGPVLFAGPSASFRKIGDWFSDGTLSSNLYITLQEIVLGYLVGASAGMVVGLLLSLNRTAARIADPFLIAVYGLPKIALAPLLVVFFGITIEPKIVLSGLLVFFVVMYTTYEGIRNIDPALPQALRLLGGGENQVRRYVIFPAALQFIRLGLKLGVPEALLGAIVGEFIVSNRGIGYLVAYSAAALDTPGVFAGLIVLTVIAVVINAIVGFFDRNERQPEGF